MENLDKKESSKTISNEQNSTPDSVKQSMKDRAQNYDIDGVSSTQSEGTLVSGEKKPTKPQRNNQKNHQRNSEAS